MKEVSVTTGHAGQVKETKTIDLPKHVETTEEEMAHAKSRLSFHEGMLVEIDGIVAKKVYNGKKAYIQGQDENTGRYHPFPELRT